MANYFKRFGSCFPSSSADTLLYAVTSGESVVGDIFFANQTATSAHVFIGLTDVTGSAAVDDWIIYDKILGANECGEVRKITAEGGNEFRVRTRENSAVSFLLTGLGIA